MVGTNRHNYKQTAEWNAINPLKPQLVYIIFRNSVRTSKRSQHLTITKINWLKLFKEIIAVYSENHTKLINTKYTRLLRELGHIVTLGF
jgi:hypothetical protein